VCVCGSAFPCVHVYLTGLRSCKVQDLYSEYIQCSNPGWELAILTHFHLLSHFSKTEADWYLEPVSSSSYQIHALESSRLIYCCLTAAYETV
jgi:hypothetical protein